MSAFADSSFLFAFYFPRRESERAMAWMDGASVPPMISPLVQYEFTQAVYFEIWLHQQTPTRGLSEISVLSALAAFEIDLEREVWTVAAPE